ncbi:hypothetical protein LTR85_004310 [Meristemomyces frigidus]|nr:hypothetical protein LTR85_004310 [Meristemomyces frigidus]
MRVPGISLALLALPTLSLAVSLADFPPTVSNVPSACKSVYTSQIDGCSATDFSGSGCSTTCVMALYDLTNSIKSACGNHGIEGENIIVAYLANSGPESICGNADSIIASASSAAASTSAAQSTTTATSVASTTEAEASSTEESTIASSTSTTSSLSTTSSVVEAASVQRHIDRQLERGGHYNGHGIVISTHHARSIHKLKQWAAGRHVESTYSGINELRRVEKLVE